MRDPTATATAADASEFRLEEESPQSGTAVLVVYGDVDLHTADALGDRLVAVIGAYPRSSST